MLNIGPEKILVILLIALIVLGPHELPGAARKVGNVLAELRQMSSGLQHDVRSYIETGTSDTPPDPSSAGGDRTPGESRPPNESESSA